MLCTDPGDDNSETPDPFLTSWSFKLQSSSNQSQPWARTVCLALERGSVSTLRSFAPLSSLPRHWPLPLLTLKIATFRVILFKLDPKDCTVSVYKDGYVGYTLPGREENFLFFIRLISLCLNPPP